MKGRHVRLGLEVLGQRVSIDEPVTADDSSVRALCERIQESRL